MQTSLFISCHYIIWQQLPTVKKKSWNLKFIKRCTRPLIVQMNTKYYVYICYLSYAIAITEFQLLRNIYRLIYCFYNVKWAVYKIKRALEWVQGYMFKGSCRSNFSFLCSVFDNCLLCCPFFFGNCIVCPLFTVSDYSFVIFKFVQIAMSKKVE